MEDSVNLLNGSKFCTILQQASIETFHLAKKIGSFVVEITSHIPRRTDQIYPEIL